MQSIIGASTSIAGLVLLFFGFSNPLIGSTIVIAGVLIIALPRIWRTPSNNPTLKFELSPSSRMIDHFDTDEQYSEFVRRMWSRTGVTIQDIHIQRCVADREIDCALASIVKGENGMLYLNVIEEGVRKTYAADERHRWKRDGQHLDKSAFVAIVTGTQPDIALRAERYANSVEEAMSADFDRVSTTDRRLVIGYQNSKGQLSYRVITRVVRQHDTFSARCHFRWGQRRTFLFEGLKCVIDAHTGQIIPLEEFVRQGRRK